MTPIFFFMDQFLYLFSTFSKEMMKICWLEVPIFGKKHHWILFFLAPRLSLWQFQMPLERLSFMKTLATLGIINASDSIVPNITRLVYLCWYMFNIFMNPGDHADLYTPNYQNQNILHRHYLWTKVCHYSFWIHYLSAVEVWRKSIK